MRMQRDYEWAAEQGKKATKQHRETAACQRRLKQMQAKRDKEAKRQAAKATPTT